MNVISGKINCNTLFLKLENYIKTTFFYENSIKFESYKRLEESAIDRLLFAPIIIYVKDKSIPANVEIDSIEQFIDNIICVEDELTLLYLYLNINKEKMISSEISCVLIESKVEIKKVFPLRTLVFLDYFIKRNQKGSIAKAGGLDYQKLENIFFNFYQNNVKKLLKNGQKYFFQNALGLNLSIYKTAYIYPKDYSKLYGSIKEIKIDEFHKDRIHAYNCPICSNHHSVVISDLKSKKKNINKYISYNGDTESYEFICKHEKTIYQGKNVNYGIKKEKYDVKTLEEADKIKIFLYMFLHEYNMDEKIYSKDSSGLPSKGIEVSKYIEIIQKKQSK